MNEKQTSTREDQQKLKLEQTVKWEQFSRASFDLKLPVHTAADSLSKGSHGHVLVQNLHAFVGSAAGIPICRREPLYRCLLRDKMHSLKTILCSLV